MLLTTDDVGLNGDFKEAIAFAVLAYWRFHDGFTGNLPRLQGLNNPNCSEKFIVPCCDHLEVVREIIFSIVVGFTPLVGILG